MPRNSSGTYSLYTPGNPVVPSTVITTTWANNTLSDLATAMTDSLSRSGDGGMLAPLELVAGAVGAPGLSWTAEPTSGLYRASAGNFRYSVSGADVTTWTSAGFAVTGTLSSSGVATASAFTTSVASSGNGIFDVNRNDAQISLRGGSTSNFGAIQLFGSGFTNFAGAVFIDAGNPGSGGTNDGDIVMRTASTERVRVDVAGGVTVGAPTGGTQGAGTINATAVYDDGVLLTPSAVGANPSASIGLSAVNGSAGTFMRSDAAPALSQSIAPTWTGLHTFSPAAGKTRFNGVSNDWSISAFGNAATGNSYGAEVNAGTNSSDLSVRIREVTGTTDYFVIRGDGSVKVGEPTGGHQGAGTINAAGYYINGAQIVGATYTPTLTNTTNISGSTSAVCQYIRVGNVVTVSGIVTATITTGGIVTVLDVSPPVASNFANTVQASGAGSANGAVINVEADAVNDRITLYWTSIGTGAQFVRFTCTYLIV